MPATTHPVTADERDIRLDRWFRRRYPALPHSRLSKLLRTGQVRVDGKRAQPGQRLLPGQQIRVPPAVPNMAADLGARPAARPAPTPDQAAAARSWVIHRDPDVIAINKPSGLAVMDTLLPGASAARHSRAGSAHSLSVRFRE